MSYDVPRYKTLFLSGMQAQVVQRIQAETMEAKRAELTLEDYREWLDCTAPMDPGEVREAAALNECAPQGYRIVGRDKSFGNDWCYLFERIQ